MCVCVFTRISHISKFATDLFEWEHAERCSRQQKVTKDTILFSKICCKMNFIVPSI